MTTGCAPCRPTRLGRPDKELIMIQSNAAAGERLERLLSYLEADPGNATLLSDTAEAAVAARQPERAIELLDRLAEARELGDGELHDLGLAALQSSDHRRAAAIYRSLVERGVGDPAVRFNLAWSLTALGDGGSARETLDAAVVEALPQAAMLQVQLLHDAGDLDAAQAAAEQALARHPDHAGLLAAVSVLAIDRGDVDLARRCAVAAGDHPDALTTLATLALETDDPHQAAALFEQALASNPNRPRALVGRGLARLSEGRSAEAAEDIDRGAELFGDHLGSFIAAGWAHFTAGDRPAARARFERAMELDPTFAEAHGSLAVMDLLEGRTEAAERKMAVAFRLDRDCASAALAQVLLKGGQGDAAGAQRVFERALTTPIDDQGRTIGQALAGLGLRD
jgi:tetratricopeptide (TPR) repeat protein